MQRLCGRRTRTLLPTVSSLLEPAAVPIDVRDKFVNRKETNTQYYVRGNRELPPPQRGDVVKMLPNTSGKVVESKIEDQVDIRSHSVRTEDCRLFRRNRRHLRKSQEQQKSVFSPSDDIGTGERPVKEMKQPL